MNPLESGHFPTVLFGVPLRGFSGHLSLVEKSQDCQSCEGPVEVFGKWKEALSAGARRNLREIQRLPFTDGENESQKGK